jgi:TctA family transporter
MSDLYDPTAMLDGFLGLMTPAGIALILAGTVVCSIFAAMPGIGTLLLLSMVLPYAMKLDPFLCIALLISIGAVGGTASTFSSVLIAVPGTAGSQATILDGHPMAKKGEAARAFGAAYVGSAVGGLFGGLVFVLSLPVMKPLVLSLGSPEFMMLVLWGLSAVGVLSGNAPIKGLMAAALGLGLSLIGTDARTGIERFTFEDFYLWDGIHLVLIALGIFAVPELVDLSVRRTSVSESGKIGKGQWEGAKDVFRHWWLVIRSSAMGVWVGMIPGLGSSVADWFAYAHAVQTEKNPETFGTGDVRGVLAPESANNAKEGGDLIPSILFGVPGGASMALMLGAFISVGIQPGEKMLGEQLPFLYAMLWVLIIANLIATSISMGFANSFAKLSLAPFYAIVPMTLVFCVVAAFNANYSWADLLVVGIFSVIGVFMKRHGWPRPPLLVAVVLGPQLQNYLWLTLERYDSGEWLLRPGVMLFFVIIALTVAVPVIRNRRRKARRMHMDIASEGPPTNPRSDMTMVLIYLGLVAFALIQAADWPPKAAVPVYAFAAFGGALALLQLGVSGVALRRAAGAPYVPTDEDHARNKRMMEIVLWIAGLGAGIVIFGFTATLFLFPLLYARTYGGGWKLALGMGISAVAILIGIFDSLIHIIWPEPLLQQVWEAVFGA